MNDIRDDIQTNLFERRCVQLKADTELSAHQYSMLARLIYQTDPHIYTALFGEDMDGTRKAVAILSELLRDGRDTVFAKQNLYVLFAGAARVEGLILWVRKKPVWDREPLLDTARRLSIPLSAIRVALVQRDYFNRLYAPPRGGSQVTSLLNVCIRLTNRDEGAGSFLLDHFIKEHPFETMELSAPLDNERAIHLFEKFGFLSTRMYEGFSLRKEKPQYMQMWREPMISFDDEEELSDEDVVPELTPLKTPDEDSAEKADETVEPVKDNEAADENVPDMEDLRQKLQDEQFADFAMPLLNSLKNGKLGLEQLDDLLFKLFTMERNEGAPIRDDNGDVLARFIPDRFLDTEGLCRAGVCWIFALIRYGIKLGRFLIKDGAVRDGEGDEAFALSESRWEARFEENGGMESRTNMRYSYWLTALARDLSERDEFFFPLVEHANKSNAAVVMHLLYYIDSTESINAGLLKLKQDLWPRFYSLNDLREEIAKGEHTSFRTFFLENRNETEERAFGLAQERIKQAENYEDLVLAVAEKDIWLEYWNNDRPRFPYSAYMVLTKGHLS